MITNFLYRSVGSVSANIAEGYSRGTGKDRARFYEYALGSARESRDWYFKARHILGNEVVTHRLSLLTEVQYQTHDIEYAEAEPPFDHLLKTIPFPETPSS